MAQNIPYLRLIKETIGAKKYRLEHQSFNEDVKVNRPRTEESYPKTNIRKSINYFVKHPNYKRVKGYQIDKDVRKNPRVGRAVNYLRYQVKLSINNIAKILGVSTRTVHRKLSFKRLEGNKAFDSAHRRLRRYAEVKIQNSKGLILTLKTLIVRAALYIIGDLDTPEQIIEGKPP